MHYDCFPIERLVEDEGPNPRPRLGSNERIQVIQFHGEDDQANRKVSIAKAKRLVLAITKRRKGSFGSKEVSEGRMWAWFYNHESMSADQGGSNALTLATVAETVRILQLNPRDRCRAMMPPKGNTST